MLAAALLALEFACSQTALALDPEKAITQYVHQAWQMEDGLPSNNIAAIIQTRDGYLWLGTEGGLVRFDGVRFTVFDVPARTLHQDRQGALWIGNSRGLTRYWNGTLTFQATSEGSFTNWVEAITEDRNGNLWVGTIGGGLNRLADGQLVPFIPRENFPGSGVASLCEDRTGNLWIGSNQGLLRLQGEEITTYTSENGLSYKDVRVLYEDRKGNLWIGTSRGGLNRFKDGRFTVYTTRDGLSHNDVRAIDEDRDGNLWIGTYGGGLNRFANGEFRQFTSKDGLSDDRILSICEDREGSLWIGTYGGGLNRLKDGRVTTYTTQEGLSHDWVYTVYEDREGSLWIGTNGGGLNQFKEGKFLAVFTTQQGLVDNRVRAIYEDSSGSLWIGTPKGLNRFQGGKFSRLARGRGLPPVDDIRSINADGEGTLWIGGNSALCTLTAGTMLSSVPQSSQWRCPVYAIDEDAHGNLWLAGRLGLGRLKDGKLTVYTTQNGLPVDMTMALHEDREGVLWIGTYGGGLVRLKEERFTVYGEESGLFDNVVYQILEDDQGYLWMSGNKGIFRVSKKALNDFAAGQIEAVTCLAFGKAEGMRAIECSGAHQPAGWKTRDGRLWFPTVKGVVMIDPENINTNYLPPPVYIEQVLINEKSVAADERLEIPPGKGDLEFHYTALSFLDPSKVRFKYKLEGHDEDWVDAGVRRAAYYTNLSPGPYRFGVIACNNDGVWNETGASFEFYLQPHFYQTNWFYALSALAVGLLGAGVYGIRVRQLKARQRELANLVNERTSDLREAKAQLEESNQNLEQRVQAGVAALAEAERMAAYGQTVAGVAHEVRHPIFALQTAAYLLKHASDNPAQARAQLDIIDREARRMTDLMRELLDFAKPKALAPAPTDIGELLEEVAKTYRAEHDAEFPKIVLAPNPDLPPMVVDRSRLLQVLVNLIQNAAKHARGLTTATISVDLVTESSPAGPRPLELCIRMKDDGAGIPPEHLPQVFDPFFTTGKGTGLGLAIVRRIINEHGGTIRVESELEQGTVFTICLPVHRKDAEDAKK